MPTTSLRSRPLAETAALARSLMRPLGLSRLTDITRLDHLGLPVFISARRGACRCTPARDWPPRTPASAR